MSRRDWGDTIAAVAAASGIGAVLGATAGLGIGAHLHYLPPLAWLTQAELAAHLPPIITHATSLPPVAVAIAWLTRYAAYWPVWAAGGAAPLAVLAGVIAWLASAGHVEAQEKGRTIASGAAVAAREARQEHRVSGVGLRIHPRLRLARDRESRGIALYGSPGSGKTVCIKYLLRAAIEQHGARILIYDNKGDFTAELSSQLGGEKMTLIAPWDARATVWSPAPDIRSSADARELATRLVPSSEGDGKQWAAGAAIILSGLIVSLSSRRGDWTWADLLAVTAADYPTMRAAAIAGASIAERLLTPGEPSPTSASYIANLSAAAGGLLSDLAAAEGDGRRKKWNVRDWLAGNGPRIVIMQGSTRFSALAGAINGAIIRALSGSLDSLPDSRKRRIYLFLDEFPQLGKVDIDPIIEVGRSKGVSPIIGAQSISQLRRIYGRDASDAWSSMIGTSVIFRFLGPENQKWASELCGKKQIRRQLQSGDRNRTNEQYADEDVVRPEQFGELGPRRAGVEGLLLTGGQTIHRLIWPYPRGWRATTASHVPAAWTTHLVEAVTSEAQNPEPQPEADEPKAEAPDVRGLQHRIARLRHAAQQSRSED